MYPIFKSDLDMFVQQHVCVLILLQSVKHRRQQAHWIMVKDGFVCDSMDIMLYAYAFFPCYEFVSTACTLEINPDICN